MYAVGGTQVSIWVLIWENASRHGSKAVRAWIHTHNLTAKAPGHGVRIFACALPVKSPWLNPIEPKWAHRKRAIVEPTRLLTALEVAKRVCAYLPICVVRMTPTSRFPPPFRTRPVDYALGAPCA